tara:strand:- start:516 stop:791 length:276 start_codon:yes stop_codon:yes gene_type:complete
MPIISKEQAVEIMTNQGGKIFSVIFEKRSTGLDRKMVCIKKKPLNNNGLKYSPREHNLLNVFDMSISEYRSVNLEGLKKIKAQGREYVIRY